MHVYLEVEMATNADRVTGLPDCANALARIDALPAENERWSRHVSVEVAAPLPFSVDQQVVAIENRVIADSQHLAVTDSNQRCAAGGDYVEALVGAAAAARGTELAYVAASPVRPMDREDVVVVGDAAVG